MGTTGWRRIAWVLLVLLSLVGLLVTAGHYFFQPSPEEALRNGYGPDPAWFTQQLPRYREHFILTFLHVVPAFLFMLLAPLQLVPTLRVRAPWLHRTIGRLFIGLSIVIAVSGAVLAVVMPFGGPPETWVALFIAGGGLICLALGVRAIRQHDVIRHRAWMSRMLAFGYAPVTMRFVLSLATEAIGLDGRIAFADSLFAAAAINLVVVQWWLRYFPEPPRTASSPERRHTGLPAAQP